MRVVINVYDIQKSCNQRGADRFGVGIYHSAVELDGMEYAYGGNTCSRATGVYACYPRSHSTFSYKLSIDLGEIPVDQFFDTYPPKDPKHQKKNINFFRDVRPILEKLMDKYKAY